MEGNKHKTIRWGILGTGRIAKKFSDDIQYAHSASLEAVASRKLASAQKFAKTCFIQAAYGSYEALFNSPGIDAIYIATPHVYQKDHAIDALNAGKHVLCEIPATINLEDLEAIIHAAEKNNRYFMEGMWSYFSPVLKKAEDWINEGRIGTLRHLKADIGFHRPFDPYLREYSHHFPRGCLLDTGIYPIAMAWRFLKKDPDTQDIWFHLADSGIEDDVVVMNTYDDNSVSAHLSASCRWQFPNYLTLIGEQGVISIPDYWCAKEAYLTVEGTSICSASETYLDNGKARQIEQISQDLLKGKLQPEEVSWNDSRAFQRHITAIKSQFVSGNVLPFKKRDATPHSN